MAGRTRKSRSEKTKPQSNRTLRASTIRDRGTVFDWREQTLARMRSFILEALPNVVEERKWKKASNGMAGVPVWSDPRGGIVCTGETYAKVVKLTFARGAAIPDPSHLFNASLDGNTRRAIDIREGERIDSAAFKKLVRAAAAESEVATSKLRSKTIHRSRAAKSHETTAVQDTPVKLLSGGNPQIAKADGDSPVQAYIAAMPGWKSDLGRRLDTLIVRAVPGVRKAVRWNSPLYGVEGGGWILGIHCLTKYVKVTFFAGTSLRPVPPGGTPKSKESRWIDLYEGDILDEGQMAAWVKQAARLPGWVIG